MSTKTGAMRVLVIRSSEWFRGAGRESSHLQKALLRPDGTRCCLGIDARECGIHDSILRGWGDIGDAFADQPHDAKPDAYPWLCREEAEDEEEGYVWASTADAIDAAAINDDAVTTDDEKIAALRPIFERNRIIIDWRPNE